MHPDDRSPHRPRSALAAHRLARFFRFALAALLGLGLATAVAPASAQKKDKGKGASVHAQKKGDKKKDKGAKDGAKDKKKGGTKPAGTPVPPASPPGPAASAPDEPVKLALSIQRVTLDNGLRVVLNVDKTSPTVAVAVTYDVGSRNEERGRSGFAHLFEHMMFQGSANVPKGEHFRLVSSHGGILNGTTSADRTNYFEVLPANELALGLWLEADRMKSLAVTAENFENQRKVVQDEYRMRVSNVAYVPSEIRLEEIVFQGYWPYEHSTIGSMADLDAAKLEWVQAFFRSHYGPNTAVLTIAGDFEPDAAIAAVHKYFDGIPRVEAAKYDEEPFPEQTSQRTAALKDSFARTPGVLYGWSLPPFRSPDHYALELTAMLLGGGESSRLHQLLVRDKAWVQSVAASTERRRGPNLFSIEAELVDGAKVGDVEKAVEAELKALGGTGPTDAELAKVRRRAQAALVLGLQSNVARATRLGEYETFFGDARLLNGEPALYHAVTKDDLKRVASQYLGATRRTIVETYPADAPGPKPGKEAGDKKDASAPKGDGAKKAEGKHDGKDGKHDGKDGKHDGKKADAKADAKKKPAGGDKSAADKPKKKKQP